MFKSESIKELATALAAFNGEVSKISKDRNNPFFKNNYATLDQIIDEVRPILTKHGLSIMQIPGGDGENVIMQTLLVHSSGEFIESEPLIMKPVRNDPQSVGSAITYARRYSLAAFLSLNTGEDDDGNKASGKSEADAEKPKKGGRNTDKPSEKPAEEKPQPVKITTLQAKWQVLSGGPLDGFEEWFNKKKQEGKTNEEMDTILTAKMTAKQGEQK